MPPTARAPAAHLPGLDLLRAAAIVAVMLCHADSFDLLSDGDVAGDYGWMGVDLFFALSGFLIAGQLLRPWTRGARPDYPRFFARRLFRTVPAYLVVVAIYFAFPALQDRPHIAPLWKFLTFTQNIGLTPGTALSHGWSLSVEEQFYLVFPVVIALLAPRATPRRVVAAIAAVVVLGIALRGWLWLHYVAAPPFDIAARPQHGGAYMTLIYYPTWTRLDGLLGGVCAALVSNFRPAWWSVLTARPNLCLAAGITGVGAAALMFGGEIGGFFAATLGFPLLALSMALLVIAGAGRTSLIGRWPVPGASALAAGAYSLYLSHKIVFRLVADASKAWPPAAQALALPVALAGALALGAALYWLVERPFLKLRDRFREPARPVVLSEAAPTAAAAIGP
jgi:peptidoglycan/LPS O-acetylase OafA/YrhL